MGVSNKQKTIKTIFKNLENTKGFERFTPNWTLKFTDETKATLKLNQENASEICGKIAEGRSYLFTLEDGNYNGKDWVAVRDVLASGGMPEQTKKVEVTPPQTQKPTVLPPADQPLNGPTTGMIINNSVTITMAQVAAGVLKPEKQVIIESIESWNEYFEGLIKSGKLYREF